MSSLKLPEFLDKARIRGQELVGDIIQGLSRRYDTARESFSYASSWGQIVLVVNNLYQLLFTYLADARTEYNPLQAKRNNSIYGNAALTGHVPKRNVSGKGVIRVRPTGNNLDELNGSTIIIPNFSRIRCLTNNIVYSLDLGTDSIIIDILNAQDVPLRIVEGVFDFQTYTGTGESIQTFEVNTPQGVQIDDQNYQVSVNSKFYPRYETLQEIPFGAPGYVGRTGIFSGIDLMFGDSTNHEVPAVGSEVRVDYLVTNGLAGNISDLASQWEWVDTAFDVTGSEVDLNEVMSTSLGEPVVLGTNAEPPELTRRIAPLFPFTQLIHDKASIKYYFEKLNIFNVVRVFRDDELQKDNRFQFSYTVFVVPRLEDRLSGVQDYFSVPLSQFQITRIERNRILNAIEESGRLTAAISINIAAPTTRRYVAFLNVEAFETINGRPVDKKELRRDIKSSMDSYLRTNTRYNKIPSSDVVKLVEDIQGVDTVTVQFQSELQESGEHRVNIDEQGSINVGNNEYAVIRGGWTRSDGQEFDDAFNVSNDKPSSVNIKITLVPPIS